MNNYSELNELSNYKSICILTHIQPDADAISSSVVLKEFLQNKFNTLIIDIFAECSKSPDSCIPILGENTLNPYIKNYQAAIMIDSPNSERLGIYKHLFESAEYKLVIDHHETNLMQGNINIVEPVSSTCEIIYKILSYFNYPITDENKGKLYAGIITDTNNFTVGKITSDSFKIASEFENHINRENIYDFYLANNSLKNMQLLALAIQNTLAYENNQIIISHITHEEANKHSATFEDFYGIINRLATINTAKLICFIKPKDDLYYVGMRSKQGANVSKIAKKYNGGGHVGAAAFTSANSLDEIQNIILNEFKEELSNMHNKINKIF